VAPKEITRGEKPKREIIISTIEFKKKRITKWESGTLLSDLTAQYLSCSYYWLIIIQYLYVFNSIIKIKYTCFIIIIYQYDLSK
jgi:hypothetical protein